MGDRWLVTGATGFVGGALVRARAAAGLRTAMVVRRGADDPRVQALSAFGDLHHHDGTTDGMREIMRSAAPDVVVHLASNFIAEHRPEDVEPLIRDNVLLGAQLLEGMRGLAEPRLVNVGSAWQHYRNAAYSPTALYAATKEAFAALLTYAVEATGVRAVTVEFTDTYGPGDPRRKLIPLMLAAEAAQSTMRMVPAEVPMDLVHIDDIVRALEIAVARTARLDRGTQERFAVRSSSAVTLETLFATWARARGRAIPVEWGARPVRAREMLEPWTQGVVLPGWVPQVPLDAGLRTL